MVLLFLAPMFACADSQWVLEQSTLSYHASHPLHNTDGVSHAARGKGVCHAGQCDFLIAAPVKSFDSGDSNRDLHMIQVTRGAQFPLVTVRTRLPEAALASRPLKPISRFSSPARPSSSSRFFSNWHERKPDPVNRLHSGHARRFQDRPAIAFGDANQERNTSQRGYDLASPVRPVSNTREFLSLSRR